MKRRTFLKKAGLCAAVAASSRVPLARAGSAKIRWRMVTSWPPTMAVLQTGPMEFAKRVEELSEGDLSIQVFAGGELVPPMGVFDAVSQGMIQCGHSAPYYWAGKVPAAQWFTAVPFGLSAQEYNTWLYQGDGLKLWEEVYAPFHLVPRPMGDTGAQMFGWFRCEMNTVSDLKGLKIRMPGLAGRVLAKAGAAVVLLPGSEIYTAFERGAIDAVNWIGPAHDMKMGFHRVAKYYYGPGWQEPAGRVELLINRRAYDALPDSLKAIVDSAAAEADMKMQAEFEALNAEALQSLGQDGRVRIKRLSEGFLQDMQKLSEEVLADAAAHDPLSGKVHAAYEKFKSTLHSWTKFSQMPPL